VDGEWKFRIRSCVGGGLWGRMSALCLRFDFGDEACFSWERRGSESSGRGEMGGEENVPGAFVGASYGWIAASTVVAGPVFGLVALFTC
jgi:hypothetical protein